MRGRGLAEVDEALFDLVAPEMSAGGTGGMAVGAIVVLSLQLGEDVPITATNLSAGDLIAGGMMAILLFQLVGYSIGWAAWWLRHR